MHLPVTLFSMLTVALQGVHTPTAETEGVSVDAPSTFVVANRSNNGRMNLIEMVRPPETVDNWSELISVAIVMHASEGATLNQFYPMWRDGYRTTCPGPNVSFGLMHHVPSSRPWRRSTSCNPAMHPANALAESKNAALLSVTSMERISISRGMFPPPAMMP